MKIVKTVIHPVGKEQEPSNEWDGVTIIAENLDANQLLQFYSRCKSVTAVLSKTLL